VGAEFATAANTVHVVERTAKPLTNCTPVRLSGTPNQGAKSLTGSLSALGLHRS
jgi:alpha-L-fucosidase 2